MGREWRSENRARASVLLHKVCGCFRVQHFSAEHFSSCLPRFSSQLLGFQRLPPVAVRSFFPSSSSSSSSPLSPLWMLNYLSACAQPSPCKTVHCLPPSSKDAFFSPIPPFLALGSWHCALATSPSGSRVPTFFFFFAFLKSELSLCTHVGALNSRPDFISCFTPHPHPNVLVSYQGVLVPLCCAWLAAGRLDETHHRRSWPIFFPFFHDSKTMWFIVWRLFEQSYNAQKEFHHNLHGFYSYRKS